MYYRISKNEKILFFGKKIAQVWAVTLRMLIHIEEKLYDKSIHTGEEPFIYDFIIVRFIKQKTWFARRTPCQTCWLKLTILFTENSWWESYS